MNDFSGFAEIAEAPDGVGSPFIDRYDRAAPLAFENSAEGIRLFDCRMRGNVDCNDPRIREAPQSFDGFPLDKIILI